VLWEVRARSRTTQSGTRPATRISNTRGRMPDLIERLTADDFQEAVDFMGMAFGFESPRDFPMLLPQIYRPTDEWMRCNYAIRRDGQIVSMVGAYPRDWQIGDETLKLVGIGGVCTHPDYRGQGLMKALMNRAVSDMKLEGCHISWLGGQRQRYQHYGYEKCGAESHFTLRRANFRNADFTPGEIRFEPMGEHYPDRIALAKVFHEAKPMHVQRSKEDFVLFLLCGFSEPWVALNAEGKVLGYLVTTPDTRGIREIASDCVNTSLDMLFAWSNRIERDLSVNVQPDDVELLRVLANHAESVAVSGSGNWQVFDWATTLQAVMKVKHKTRGLAEGKVRIGIGEETYLATVDSTGASCVRDEGETDISLTSFPAHRVMFGPARPSDGAEVPDSARILESWAPLPLGFLRADCV
jgi:predicted N-acetyltransferase YhbS